MQEVRRKISRSRSRSGAAAHRNVDALKLLMLVVLAGAPAAEDGRIRVPRILGEEA